MPRDTTPEAATIQLAIVRRHDGATRLRNALALSDTTRALALARLKAEHPDLSDRQLIGRLLRQSWPAIELPPNALG